MNIKRLVPDTITSCNLLCGAVAVLMATEGAFLYAFLFILLGAFFDFFDGMSARLLKVPSPLGIQMDSLADDITFGLAPAMMLCCYLRPLIGWWCLIALLMAAASARRLAKFNIDERETSSFIGLATPANAIFWGSLCCMTYAMMAAAWMPWVLLALSLLSCYLLNAEIPFFSFKFHGFGWKEHLPQYLFLIGAVVIITFCIVKACIHHHPMLAVFAGAACVLWYVLMNLLWNIVKK